MSYARGVRIAAISLLLAVSACSDAPLDGVWRYETEVDCGGGERDRPVLDIDGDFGSGSYCQCRYQVTIEDAGDGAYTFDADFSLGCPLPDAPYSCVLRDEVRLDCGQLGVFTKS